MVQGSTNILTINYVCEIFLFTILLIEFGSTTPIYSWTLKLRANEF